MIENTKIEAGDPEKQSQKTGPKPVDTADAHALQSHLKQTSGSEGLSAIFSSQAKQIQTGEQKKADADDLEQRLARYQEKKREDREGNKREPEPEEPFDEDLVRDVAEQILVSDKEYMDAAAQSEVRIKINGSILKDTHVHLGREKDGLKVKLISSDKYAIQTLTEASGRLEDQLKKNFKGKIEIDIIHLTPQGGSESVRHE
ncbi:type III secretion HpaP family protein [Desulfospira joergensenii]|uniref:type III secretion HpaP family protein n=1 Tax=Desulfospira joergensenii TaxID=53329 RepID=UPI0003B4CC36|nr:type III secretion HpaP family protein [Desulfospira joergensenii]